MYHPWEARVPRAPRAGTAALAVGYTQEPKQEHSCIPGRDCFMIPRFCSGDDEIRGLRHVHSRALPQTQAEPSPWTVCPAAFRVEKARTPSSTEPQLTDSSQMILPRAPGPPWLSLALTPGPSVLVFHSSTDMRAPASYLPGSENPQSTRTPEHSGWLETGIRNCFYPYLLL